MNTQRYDVAIVGGGIVGLSLACALARQTSLSIVILERKTIPSYDVMLNHPRVSAITQTSKKILQSIQVWDEIKNKKTSHFTEIHVWDNQTKLTFNAQSVACAELGYIIENHLIVHALFEQIKKIPNIKWVIDQLEEFDEPQVLLKSRTQCYAAKLVVAADGANSWVRSKANIEVDHCDYHQSAIVCSLTTELLHQNIARQIFLPTGPLAFLPLSDPNLCSIVWTLPKDIAQSYLGLTDEEFNAKLFSVFPYLGRIESTHKRFSFPLSRQSTKAYVKNAIALVGDAAHTVHPLAGQGVNMGLLDAISLVDVIKTSHNQKRNYASLATLRRYERWRKADNFSLFTGIDLIKKCFANQSVLFQGLRSVGMEVTDQSSIIKNLFVRHAIGERQKLPDWI